MKTIELTVNGERRKVLVRPNESLLDVLRERFGVISVKDGCKPQGQCGCCLAIVDGKARTTCATDAASVDGKEILTLEGLTEEERKTCAQAFVLAGGVQCGFCTPGLVMRAKHLVDKNPSPTRQEIAKAIDGNLCRCTGYVRVIDAIDLYAKAKRGEALGLPSDDGRVGHSLVRYGAYDMAIGKKQFVSDLTVPNMLRGAIVQSAHARAKVLGINTDKARALPGVVAVATAADVPGARWYGLIYKDWPGLVAIGEEARCVGDVIAVVAAEDEYTARQAAALVEVDYEVLPAVTTPEDALRPDAPRVNPVHDNILSRTAFQRGDVDEALDASAHIVSGTFRTQRIEHLFLEPEAALAIPDTAAGTMRMFTQGQGIFDDRRQVSAFLAMPEEKLFVELVPSGGAFGGKEDLSIQAHTALLAKLTGRPVKITLNREESIRMHPKRHPITMEYTVGCNAEGRLTAVRARMLGDSGAYASVGAKVLERAAGHACGPYRVPHVDIEATAVYTNNPPCGAMRGFGANQAAFAIEGCLDMLAEKVGLDGWSIRWRNAVDIGDQFTTGQIFEKSVGVRKTLQAVKEAYYEAKERGRAVGIACGIKNSGIGNGAKEWGKCRLVVETDGTISLYNGYTEMGQGLLTVLTQFAVEVTGLPASIFRPKVDTKYALDCGQTTGSRATLFGGRAVKSAAEKLLVDLQNGFSVGDLVGKEYPADELVDDTTPPGGVVSADGKTKIKTHTSFGFATQLCILDETGRIERMVAAHDVGRAVNPDLCCGQIEGAVHMGLGYALTEELPCENGMPVTFNLREIGVLRARDMPEVEVILVEDPEPEGPFGAKGAGEIGLVPTAGAVAGALAAFDGTRHYTLPMKSSPAAKCMSVGRIRRTTAADSSSRAANGKSGSSPSVPSAQTVPDVTVAE